MAGVHDAAPTYILLLSGCAIGEAKEKLNVLLTAAALYIQGPHFELCLGIYAALFISGLELDTC